MRTLFSGPVVFLSKCLGMLPVIWTDDDAESDCKSYFNLYTFIVFLAWIGVTVISGMRVDLIDPWPAAGVFTPDNVTDSARFLGRVSLQSIVLSLIILLQMTVDTYLGSVMSNALIAVMFGIFKCTNFAEVLYSISQLDSQLELKEKHYDKIKRKTLYWVVVEIFLLVLHMVGIVFMFEDVSRYGYFVHLTSSSTWSIFLQGPDPARADPLRQHGHRSAGPPVHPHVYGHLQEIQNSQQDHPAHCQALQNLQSRG